MRQDAIASTDEVSSVPRAREPVQRDNGEGRTTWCAPGTRLTVFRRSSRIRSNNYGPLPLPRKVDPAHHPQRARGQAPARVRAGKNVRDRLYVEDHNSALMMSRNKDRSAKANPRMA